MKILGKIIKYQLNDTIRSKWIITYTIFYLLLGYGLLSFSNNSSKVMISLMNIIIIIIPLISLIFGTIFLYNNKNTITFLLSQPINRKTLYLGLYLGLILPLIMSFLFGLSIPILFYINNFTGDISTLLYLFTAGIFLTTIFGSLAFLISTINEDRLKGLGVSIFVWLVFAALYDGIILLILQVFQDYPLEKVSIVLSLINPVDLARILVILKFDISALMGYTGAVFQDFFGNAFGIFVAFLSLLAWTFIPVLIGLARFKRKDF